MDSAVVDGEVLDFHYKKRVYGSYKFSIGHLRMGQVWNMGRHWAAFSYEPNDLGVISGFKNRFYASEFLLRLNGIWKKAD